MSAAPHPFTLRQLQYVVAVAEELSFRRAAARCRVSQPSLSAQLAQVEGSLGVRLFAGRDLVERAKRLLLEADDIVRAAQRVADPLSGTIRLDVIPTISPYLLPSVTLALRRSRSFSSRGRNTRSRRKKRPVTEAELRGEELLLLDEGHRFRDQALEECGTARVREGAFRATSLSTLVQMVAPPAWPRPCGHAHPSGPQAAPS
jgi:LysR family hydrogen peroxide-inducible transcriptional activator